MHTIPPWATREMKALRRRRDLAQQDGHNVDRITIGFDPAYNPVDKQWTYAVRVCDDDGAYDFTRPNGRTIRKCVGYPGRALETIANYKR